MKINNKELQEDYNSSLDKDFKQKKHEAKMDLKNRKAKNSMGKFGKTIVALAFLGIVIIGIIFLIIPVCFVIGTQDILINILTCISTVGYSLYFVLIKYLKHVYYRSPFQLSFILV